MATNAQLLNDILDPPIGMGCQMVSADFARKLERERDEANYFLNELAEVDGQLKFRINELCEVLRKTEKERDEARERYNELLGVEVTK
jgi:hypothetical protein